MTNICLLESRAWFDESGYFDPVALMLSGEMSRQRVGGMLPLGYIPK